MMTIHEISEREEAVMPPDAIRTAIKAWLKALEEQLDKHYTLGPVTVEITYGRQCAKVIRSDGVSRSVAFIDLDNYTIRPFSPMLYLPRTLPAKVEGT